MASAAQRHCRGRTGASFARAAAAVIFVLSAAAAPVLAAEAQPPRPADDAGGEPKTLKERLSDKASDEQRIDDCGVPPDRRGPKPRPDCASDAAAAKTATTGIR